MKFICRCKAVLTLLVLLCSHAKIVVASESLRVAAKESAKCTAILPYYARKHKVPKFIAKSIMLKESGKWHPKLRRNISWPWAVNVAGKSHYFNSKKEAVRFVRGKLRRGIRNIDVGCMQINLHYHSKNFRSLQHALDPSHNVSYSMKLLRGKYQRLKRWSKAVEHYHSGGTKHGKRYSREVISQAHSMQKKYSNIKKRRIRKKNMRKKKSSAILSRNKRVIKVSKK